VTAVKLGRLKRGASGAESMDLMAGDDRREQGVAILQTDSEGRTAVAEVFKGMAVSEETVAAVLSARSRVIDQFGRVQRAGLVIGQALLDLSRRLSDDEFKAVRRGTERLFPFSDSLATKFRRAAEEAERLGLPTDALPSYSVLYEISTLPPGGLDIVKARGMLRPDVRQAEIAALRRELKAYKFPDGLLTPEDEAPVGTVSLAAIQRRHSQLLAKRETLLAQVRAVDSQIGALAEQLRLLAGGMVIDQDTK
jgi:hypothetical protein